MALPKTMEALVLKPNETPAVHESVPTPHATEGSAVIAILAAATTNFMKFIYANTKTLSEPMIPGTSAIGRVVTTGPDSTNVKAGDLVFFDCVVRSRDEPNDVYLSAVPFALPAAQNLRSCFRHGAFAEYCRAPLENLTALNEERLLGDLTQGGLEYKVEQLALATLMLVPFGGLQAMNLKVGETVIIAPATGSFGGCAILCAQAMGARVIAMGRDEQALARLKAGVAHPERLSVVPITEHAEHDLAQLKKLGPIDAFLDIGPPQGYLSTHIKSAILALNHGARICFMAGYKEDVAIPYSRVMNMDMRIQGRYMYERSDIAEFFKMVQNGNLDFHLGKINGRYPLERWKEAWDAATEKGLASLTVIVP